MENLVLSYEMKLALKVIGLTLMYLWLFWAMYVVVMGIYRAHLAKKLTPLLKFLSLPFILIGIILDVFAQYTIATIFFLDLPRWNEHLVTKRLARYVEQENGHRHIIALYICDHVLDIFDPTGNHC